MNKSDFENLAIIRIKEAEVLLNAGCFHGTYYLAGYALERALACIAKQVKEFDFPDQKRTNDSYTHNLSKLIDIAGLKQELSKEEILDKDFKLNWST